jgi:hypothetical protein
MKTTRYTISLFLFCFIILTAFSQNAGVGQWRDHLPFNYFIAVTETPDKVFGATPYAVLTYDKVDESIERFSKINGLSDIEVSDIGYSEELQTVVLAYTNTNIDLFKGNYIVNIPDIKRKPILGNKVINSVSFRGEFAYLSCGFGIVVLDINNEEIADTWYIGPEGSQINVYDLTHNDTAFFAATEDGIFYASLSHPNLADFSAWEHLDSAPYPVFDYDIIEAYEGYIFANLMEGGSIEDDSIFYYDGNTWEYLPLGGYHGVNSITASAGKLMIALNYAGKVFNENLEEEMLIYTYNPGTPVMNDAIYSSGGEVWVADGRRGLVKSFADGWASMSINPGGPVSASVFSMTSAGDQVWVAPGGLPAHGTRSS